MNLKKSALTALAVCPLVFVVTALLTSYAGNNDYRFTRFPLAEPVFYAIAGMYLGCLYRNPRHWLTYTFALPFIGLFLFTMSVGAQELLGDWSVYFTPYQFAEDVAFYGSVGVFIGLVSRTKKVVNSVTIYPEGKIITPGQRRKLDEWRPGTGDVVAKLGVPVGTVAIIVTGSLAPEEGGTPPGEPTPDLSSEPTNPTVGPDGKPEPAAGGIDLPPAGIEKIEIKIPQASKPGTSGTVGGAPKPPSATPLKPGDEGEDWRRPWKHLEDRTDR